MSKEFIRGSQIGFHFLHMFMQSLKRIAVISLFIAVLAMANSLVRNANPYIFQPNLTIKFTLAKIQTAFDVEKQVKFIDVYHQSITTSNYKYVNWYQKQILPEIIKQIKLTINTGLQWFLMVFITITIILYLKGRRQKRDQYLRGVRLIKPYKLKWKIFCHNVRFSKFRPYKIAKFPYPNNTEFQHTIITGASGTGKTQVMIDLLNQIRARGDKAIIYDKMGTYVRKFYDPNKDFILNPFDNRSKYWDYFLDAKTKSDFDIMSASLIETPKSGDPFWTTAAKTVLTEAAFAIAAKPEPNNQKLCDFLLKSSSKKFAEFLSKTDAVSIIDSKADKTAASIRSVLSTYINPLKFLTNSNNERPFSIKNWIKNSDDSFLFLSSIADKHESLKPLLSLWLDLSLNALLSQDQQASNRIWQRRIWFIIDELPSLQKLPALTYGLAESRQFGGSFVISMQLMAQLREIYGKDGAESISGLCRNRLTFATPDQETARWCSENLGKKEMMISKENLSFGASEFKDGVNITNNKEQENIVIPTEIMSLKDLQFYIKLSNGFPVAKSKIKYQNQADKANKLEERQLEATTQMLIPIDIGDEFKLSAEPKTKSKSSKTKKSKPKYIIKDPEPELDLEEDLEDSEMTEQTDEIEYPALPEEPNHSSKNDIY
jgi:type IV conjugative transfer system coupling protein TraD